MEGPVLLRCPLVEPQLLQLMPKGQASTMSVGLVTGATHFPSHSLQCEGCLACAHGHSHRKN